MILRASTNRTRPPQRVLRGLAVLAALALLGSCAVDKAALAKRIDLQSPDIAAVADGTYEAAYTIDPPVMAANKSVKVRVTVAGGRYTAIELLAPASLATGKAFTELAARVVKDQALTMDAVSSATITSAAVLRAVQLAVTAGR